MKKPFLSGSKSHLVLCRKTGIYIYKVPNYLKTIILIRGFVALVFGHNVSSEEILFVKVKISKRVRNLLHTNTNRIQERFCIAI